MTQMALETNFRLTWLISIENTLNECGLSFIWTYQTFHDANWLKRIVKITLEDQFTQTWFSSVEASAKTLNYRLFKESLKTEKYFDVLNDKDGFTFCKFRMVNHKLPIECGSGLISQEKIGLVFYVKMAILVMNTIISSNTTFLQQKEINT